WKPVTGTELLPTGFNITESPSAAISGIVVLNDVRSQVAAYIDNATVTAASVTITAAEQSVIRALADSTALSSGGSSFTGQGRSRRRAAGRDAGLRHGLARPRRRERLALRGFQRADLRARRQQRDLRAGCDLRRRRNERQRRPREQHDRERRPRLRRRRNARR